jgi:transposase-like protein
MSDDTKTTAQSNSELATILGVHRNTIRNWRALPGAPKGLDVAQWREFQSELSETAPESSLRQQLMNRKLLAECIERERKNAIEARDLIHYSKIAPDINACVLTTMNILEQKLERELPERGAGKSKEALRALGREIVDNIGAIYQALVKQYADEEAARDITANA